MQDILKLNDLLYPRLTKLAKGDIVTGPSVYVRPSVTTLLTLYTEHLSTDLNQTWYTVNIWHGLEAYLFSRS